MWHITIDGKEFVLSRMYPTGTVELVGIDGIVEKKNISEIPISQRTWKAIPVVPSSIPFSDRKREFLSQIREERSRLLSQEKRRKTSKGSDTAVDEETPRRRKKKTPQLSLDDEMSLLSSRFKGGVS